LAYRHEAFRRESELLEKLLGKARCLQLVQPLHDLVLSVATATGGHIILSCPYFVTEWLDGDIQAYFDMQDQFEALAKLSVFRDAALACFALHGHQIHHRDLKADNLMTCAARGGIVVAIDLGTAARRDSAAILSRYFDPVGWTIYSPPEEFFGLSGVRAIGEAADIYALGCLLYGLFNAELFYSQLLRNVGFLTWRGVCEHHMRRVTSAAPLDDARLMSEWSRIAGLTKRQVTLPRIDEAGSTVTRGTASILNELLWKMTAIDFNDRIKAPDDVLRRIDSAIRVLKNAVADRVRAELRKARRDERRVRESEKQARLSSFLRK
jgi:serine/threonine protein kinase